MMVMGEEEKREQLQLLTRREGDEEEGKARRMGND
jgi:hypothetical protein